MMNLIAPQYNVNTTKNTDGDNVTQIPPVNIAPFPAGTFVPADDIAPSDASGTRRSAGAGARRPTARRRVSRALDADTTGEIDFARSSRGPEPR